MELYGLEPWIQPHPGSMGRAGNIFLRITEAYGELPWGVSLYFQTTLCYSVPVSMPASLILPSSSVLMASSGPIIRLHGQTRENIRRIWQPPRMEIFGSLQKLWGFTV